MVGADRRRGHRLRAVAGRRFRSHGDNATRGPVGVRWCCCCRCCWRVGGRRFGAGGCAGGADILGGVCFRPADTAGGPDAGRAGRHLRLTRSGMSSGISSAVIVAARPSYCVASKQNSMSWRRSRWLASCCQVPSTDRPVHDQLVGRVDQRPLPVGQSPRSVVSASGQAKIVACRWRPDRAGAPSGDGAAARIRESRKCPTRRITNSVSTRGSRPRSSRPP